MARWAAAVAIWILSAGLAQADPAPKDFLGVWTLPLDGRNLFVITLAPDGAGIGGTVDAPAGLNVLNGGLVTIDKPGVARSRIVRAHLAGAVLCFTAQSSRDPKDTTGFVMRLDGSNGHLAFGDKPSDIGPGAFRLARATAPARVATDWQLGRAYSIDDADDPSGAMKTIYDADQAERSGKTIDWNVVAKSDAARRERTRALLAAGALHTGKDYEEAAFVFQHGDAPDDYLLAHTLAVVAVSKGDGGAVWIAAATLDRYLQKIGREQVYGTQFVRTTDRTPWTQAPYDRALVSDALRRQLGVPPLAAQADQIKNLPK